MITIMLILLTLLEQPAECGKRKLGKLIGKEICTMKHSSKIESEVIFKV